MRGRNTLGIAALAVLAVAAAAAPSQATFRGQNGLLVFEAPAGANRQLFTIKPDGTGLRQVTHFSDSGGTDAKWSKDSSRIVFTRNWDPGGANEKIVLYTMNADGSGAKALPKGGDLAVSPNWFPNGRRIIFLEIHSGKLSVINASGKGLRPAGIPGVGRRRRMLPARRPARRLPATEARQRVVVRNLRRRHLRARTEADHALGRHADKIDCSPDGKRVVYSAPEFGEPGGTSSNVYTMKTDGTGVAQLTHETGGTINDGADSWSPDGTRIAFTSNRTGTYQIYTMNADGTDVKQLTKGADAHLAAWSSHP